MRNAKTVIHGIAPLLTVVAVIGAGAVLGSSSAWAETVLRFNRWLPPKHNVQHGVMGEWARQITAATSGRVKVEFTASSLGPPPRQFDLAAQGIADIVLGVHSYSPSRFRLTQIVEMPFLGDRGEAISGSYWDVHQKYLAQGNEHDGVKLLALWVHGPGVVTNRSQPITKIADFQGLKLRVSGGIMTEAVSKLGAVPIQAPVPQLYELLSRGVADGAFFTGEGITEFNLQKLMKYVTTVPGGLFNTSFFLAMNPAKWASLSPQDQAAIEKLSAKPLSMAAGRSYDNLERVAEKDLKAAGIQITAADTAFVTEIRERLAPLERAWIEDAKRKGVDGVEALKALRGGLAR